MGAHLQRDSGSAIASGAEPRITGLLRVSRAMQRRSELLQQRAPQLVAVDACRAAWGLSSSQKRAERRLEQRNGCSVCCYAQHTVGAALTVLRQGESCGLADGRGRQLRGTSPTEKIPSRAWQQGRATDRLRTFWLPLIRAGVTTRRRSVRSRGEATAAEMRRPAVVRHIPYLRAHEIV